MEINKIILRIIGYIIVIFFIAVIIMSICSDLYISRDVAWGHFSREELETQCEEMSYKGIGIYCVSDRSDLPEDKCVLEVAGAEGNIYVPVEKMNFTEYVYLTFRSMLFPIVFIIAVLFFVVSLIREYRNYRQLMERAKKCTKECKGIIVDSKMDYIYEPVYQGRYSHVRAYEIKEGLVEVIDNDFYRKGDITFYKAEIEYEVNGGKLRNSSIYPSTVEYTNGSEIMIKYNPEFVGDIVDENAEKNNFDRYYCKKRCRKFCFMAIIVVFGYIVSYFILPVFNIYAYVLDYSRCFIE